MISGYRPEDCRGSPPTLLAASVADAYVEIERIQPIVDDLALPTHSGMITRHLLSRLLLPHSASAIGYQHIARHGVVAPVERDQHRSGGLC